MGGHGHLATKIDITFFVGVQVLNVFYLTIFSKKTIFPKITAKNNFWGTWPFLRERGNEYNFFCEKWGTEYCLSFFPQKPHTGWMKAEKPVSRDINFLEDFNIFLQSFSKFSLGFCNFYISAKFFLNFLKTTAKFFRNPKFHWLLYSNVSTQFFQHFFITKNDSKLHHNVCSAPSRKLEVFPKFH